MAGTSQLIEQHLEEAAFLWTLRDRAVSAPDYSLLTLTKLDWRLEAHLDGLRVAGPDGWATCQQSLEATEPGATFVAAVLVLERGDGNPLLRPILAGALGSPAGSRELISAFGWVAYSRIAAAICSLGESDEASARRIAIGAAAVHRRFPGRILEEAFQDPDTALRRRALRAVGELTEPRFLDALTKSLSDADDESRFWAAWSATLLGHPKAIRTLSTVIERGKTHRDDATRLLFRRLDRDTAKAYHRDLANDQDLCRFAVIGAGAHGDPRLVPWLIEQMAKPSLARPAGEALTLITGIDLEAQHLLGEMPTGFVSGPTDNPADDDVSLDPDANLPWPHKDLVSRWWDTACLELKRSCRHFMGRPLDSSVLESTLRDGRQRHRAAAAVELAINNARTPLFEVRAPGFHQQHLLGINRVHRGSASI